MKKGKRKFKISRHNGDDDKWIRQHFEELVDKYGGQYLVLAAGEPFIGYDAAQLFRKARRKHPRVTPTCMPIPEPEDFVSILTLCPK